MKITAYPFVLITILVLSLVSASAYGSDDSPWDRKLPFKTAIIKYEITGMETGTETLYVKDYGAHRAKEHDGTTSLLGMKMRNRTLEITDPDWIYTFDLEKKTGTRRTNPLKYYQEEYAKLSRSEKKNVRKNAEELGLSLVRDLNGQIEQNATEILGYPCDKTTIMGMSAYVIHQTDIPLQSEFNIMGLQGKIVAVSLTNDSPPADVFTLPPDITPVHDVAADSLAQQMVVSSMNTLKEPDGARKLRTQAKNSAGTGVATPEPVPPPTPVETEPEPDREQQTDPMNEAMRQGMEMLNGLFGN